MIDTIISASAGTGKTRRIVHDVFNEEERSRTSDEVQRLLKRTVFLSFSNAAVDELKSRLLGELEKRSTASLGSLSLKEAERLLGRPRVDTIHSFCLEVARALRYDMGLPADMAFPMLEDSSPWTDAVGTFLALRWNAAVLPDELSAQSGLDRSLAEALVALADRSGVKRFLETNGPTLFFLSRLGHQCESDEATTTRALARAGCGTETDPDVRSEAFVRLRHSLAVARKWVEALKPEGREKAFSENPEIARDLCDISTILLGCNQLLMRVATMIGERYYLPALLTDGTFDFDAVVFLVAEHVKHLRDRSGEPGCRAFLERLEDVELGFDRLVVDEAQDNDLVQNLLLMQLGAWEDAGQPGSVALTMVGDPKQSIYAWRNAFPEAFVSLYDDMGKVGEALGETRTDTLKTSGRIDNETTLSNVNRLCDMVADRLPEWGYVTSRDRLSRSSEARASKAGEWSFWPSPKGKKARRVLTDGAKKALRDFCSEGSVGIVCRSRGDLFDSGIFDAVGDRTRIRIPLELKEAEDVPDGSPGSLGPEFLLLRSLLHLLEPQESHLAALEAVFSPFSRQLRGAVDKAVSTSSLPAALASLYVGAQKVGSVTRGGGIGPLLYVLFDRLQLWRLVGPMLDGAQLLERQREIHHAITNLHLREMDTARTAGTAALGEGLERTVLPFAWYGLQGPRESTGIEACTVHGAKGLQYDKVVVVADFQGSFLRQDVDRAGSKDGPVLSQLFQVKAGGLLMPDSPSMEISFFPYFTGLTAKLLKEWGESASAGPVPLDPRIAGVYHHVAGRLARERANLFYVAITRARTDLLMIDRGFPTETEPFLKPLLPSTAGMMVPAVAGAALDQIELLPHVHARTRIVLPDGLSALPVREEVRDQMPSRSVGSFGRLSPSETWNHLRLGSRIHAAVESVLERMSGPADYESLVRRFCGGGDDLSGLARDFLLRDDNRAAVCAAHAAISDRVRVTSEVRVWTIDATANRIVRGVIDTLALQPGRHSVVEFKVAFSAAGALRQEQRAREQAGAYVKMLADVRAASSFGFALDPVLISVF